MEIMDAQTLLKTLAAVYTKILDHMVFQIQDDISGIKLKHCGNADTYAVGITKKGKNSNLYSKPSS